MKKGMGTRGSVRPGGYFYLTEWQTLPPCKSPCQAPLQLASKCTLAYFFKVPLFRHL